MNTEVIRLEILTSWMSCAVDAVQILEPLFRFTLTLTVSCLHDVLP